MIITYNHLIEQLDFTKFHERPVNKYDDHMFDYMLTFSNMLHEI